ncbi:MAG: hypothetical protein OEZ10_05335 [Gammaproteobacteria bacterium]|nr:hypothetical protein [Gammaproteobacteria bacterium]
MFQKNRTSEMIVKPAWSPKAKMTIAGIVALVVVLGGTGLYNYGLNTAGFKKMLANQQVSSLESRVTALQEENQDLRDALARAERTLQMDQTAYQELEGTLAGSSGEIAKLREELNFYRNIISPPNKKGGLRIQSMKLEPTRKNGEFSYKLVLIQALTHEQTIRGDAKFEVTGMQAGKTATISFPESKPIDVNFRYFQDVEGKLALPGNFEPRQIRVQVTTRGRNAQTVEAVYTWPRA